MLSVNYIATFLDKEQKKINDNSYCELKKFEYKDEYDEFIQKKINEKIKNNTEFDTSDDISDDTSDDKTVDLKDNNENNTITGSYNNLEDCFDKYFEKHLFGINKDIDKNRNNVFTFFSSIFGIGDENYYLLDQSEKIECIKMLIKKMDDELFVENYYNEFKYDKNKFFNKEKIMKSLKDSFRMRIDENFDLVKKYISDYLGINIVIFELQDNKIIDKYIISSNKYTDEHNIYLPYYFIIKENDVYIPIMINENKSINYIGPSDSINIDSSDSVKSNKKYKITDMLVNFNSFTINHNIKNVVNDLKKMKIIELREYCIENNINIYKTSEKTGKEIKKTKDDLILDCCN